MLQSLPTQEAPRLGQLLAEAEGTLAADVRVRSCLADSRTCQPGAVFVALEGSAADGHDFARQAVARGAAVVVAERPLALDVPVCVVPDAREAFGRICQALAGHPSRSLRLIGVTGTNGKTTTAHLIASVLEAAGLRAGLLGTLGYDDTIHRAPADLTTPAAPALAEWLARMVAHGCSHAVMEVSSHAIAQHRISGMQFAHVCLTNLRRDHLDYHGTLADYHRTKTSLFGDLAPAGMAIINADDPASLAAAPLLPGGVLSIGIEHPADLRATLVERYKSEQTFLVRCASETVPVRTAMIGDHHIHNCLMAAAVGLAEGIDLATIARGLEAVRHVPGRLERIECGQPFGVFVDFAHTPDALAAALSALREVTTGRLVCVFGAGGNRDAEKRPLMGRAVENQADLAIVTTDNPRCEDPQTIASEILAGFEHSDAARWVPDRAEAIRYALSLAGPDDVVLVAGRGHETHQIVAGARLPLDDRDVVRGYLYNLAPTSQYGALQSVGNS